MYLSMYYPVKIQNGRLYKRTQLDIYRMYLSMYYPVKIQNGRQMCKFVYFCVVNTKKSGRGWG